MPTQILEIDFSLPNLSDSQAQVDAFYGSLQQLENEAPNLSSLLSTIGPSLDLSSLQSQIDSITSQLSDFEAALGLGAESVLTLGSNADDAGSQLGDMSAAADLNTESLTNFGATTETATEQVARLGSASEEGASQTRAHGQAAGEAESEFSGLGEALGEVSNIIPGLNGGLTQGTSLFHAFTQEAKDGQDQMALIGAGVAALGVGIAGLSWESFDNGLTSVHLLAEQTGMADQSVAGFQLTLKEAGLSADTANMALERIMMNTQNLISNLDAGKAPTGTFATGLQEIGISAQQAAATGGDMNKLLPMIADGMQHTSEAAQAQGRAFDSTGVSMQVFGGRYGAQLAPVLVQGSAALAQNTEYVKQLGLASEEQVAHLEDWEVASSKAGEAALAFGAAVGSDMAPAMTTIANAVGSATAALDQLPAPLRDAVVTIPLLGGAALSAAAGVSKLFDLMSSGASVISGAVSSYSAWVNGIGAAAAPTEAAAAANVGLATSEDAVAASGAGAASAAAGLGDAAAVAAPEVEADATANTDLATAQGLVAGSAPAAAAGVGAAATSTAGAGDAAATAGTALGAGGLAGALGVAAAAAGVLYEAVQSNTREQGVWADAANDSSGAHRQLTVAVGDLTLGLVDLDSGLSTSQDQIQATTDDANAGWGALDHLGQSATDSGNAARDATGPWAGLDNVLKQIPGDMAGAAAAIGEANSFLGQFGVTLTATGQTALVTAKTITQANQEGVAAVQRQTNAQEAQLRAAQALTVGNTELANAENDLVSAYQSGNPIAIAAAQGEVTLAQARDKTTGASKDATSAYNAETAAMGDNIKGKSDLAAAENNLAAAYRSGDPAQVQAAQRALSLAEAQDSAASSSSKAGSAAISEANSLQSVTDALAKAGTAADQLNTKYNDLISGAFLKQHDLSMQAINDENMKGLAAQQSAQTAYAAWSGFDSAYQADLASEAAAIQAGDKAGADYWKNQAAAANTSANDQKTALTGFITEAEKDYSQAGRDAQTLYKDMQTAGRNSVADQKAAFSELETFIKTFATDIPASYQSGLSQAQSVVQGFYSQLTALDQSYAAGSAGLTQQEYEDKRTELNNELSDAKDTYSAEAQAASDMGKAIADSDKARLDTHAQMLQQQTFDEQSAADNAIGIWDASIATQEQVNVISGKKNAAELNAILEQEAASVDYWTEKKIEYDNAYKEIQVDNALLTQDIDQQKANIEIALANLEVGLATQTAQTQIDAQSQTVNAATAAGTAIAATATSAYGTAAGASSQSSSAQIANFAAVAQAAINSAEAQTTADNQGITANEKLAQSYQSAAQGAQQMIDAAKAAASNEAALSDAANKAAESQHNLANATNAVATAMQLEVTAGKELTFTGAGLFGAGASGGSGASGTPSLASGASGGSASPASGAGGAGGAGGSLAGNSGIYEAEFEALEQHLAAGTPMTPALSLAMQQVAWAATSSSTIDKFGDIFGPSLAQMISQLQAQLPGSYTNSAGLELFVPSSAGQANPTLTSGGGASSSGYEMNFMNGQLQEILPSSFGANPGVTSVPYTGPNDINFMNELTGMHATMQQIQQLLQQNGGLPVSLSNPQDVATAVTSGTTNNIQSRPVGV